MAQKIQYKNSNSKQLAQRQKHLKQLWQKGVRPEGANKRSIDELIDKDEVRRLAAFGATQIEIANFYGISRDSVRKYFTKEIEQGHQDMKFSLRRKQLDAALNGSNTMLVWLGKQILGQVDKQEVDHNHAMTDLLKEVGYIDDPMLIEGEKIKQIEENIEQGETLGKVGIHPNGEPAEVPR
tara:strand:+ start:1145 stop:1687 length:543 start_codon:yes stop_codon:yes gene_type:complete